MSDAADINVPRLIGLRHERGFRRQEDLARVANVSVDTISALEAGGHNPTVRTFCRV